jgi:hypothetical protein
MIIKYFDKDGCGTLKKDKNYNIKKEFKTEKEYYDFCNKKIQFKNAKLNKKGEWEEQGETKEYLLQKLEESDNFNVRIIEDLYDFVNGEKASEYLKTWIKNKKDLRNKFINYKKK